MARNRKKLNFIPGKSYTAGASRQAGDGTPKSEVRNPSETNSAAKTDKSVVRNSSETSSSVKADKGKSPLEENPNSGEGVEETHMSTKVSTPVPIGSSGSKIVTDADANIGKSSDIKEETRGAQSKEPWTGLFQGARLAEKGMPLKFIAPVIKDGNKTAVGK